MPGIQFLDDDGSVLDEPEPSPPPPARRRVLGDAAASWSGVRGSARIAALVAPLLWVAAAVVAVVACFQQVFGERIGSGALYVQAADGWGRYASPDDVSVATHTTRYGELVCVAAGVLVVAAVLHVLRRRAAVPVALAGAAALLGCVATVWLMIHTQFQAIRAAFSRPGTLRPQVLQLHYGPFMIVGVMAAAIAGLGCLAAVKAARAESAATAGTRAADPNRTPAPGVPAALVAGSASTPAPSGGAAREPAAAPPGPLEPVPAARTKLAGESNLTADLPHDDAQDELLGAWNG